MDVATVSISESRTFTVTVTEYERLIEENARLRYENEFLSRENQELKLSEEKTRREFEEAYRSSLIREQGRMCALENYRVSGHMQYQHTRWSAMSHEIVVQIMDYLDQQDDKKTLLRCALVCRSWASSSRKYTFTSLTVSLWTSGARRLRLYGLLDHPLCTFASAVRTLRIDADSNERYGTYAGWLDPLIPCLHKLSAVQHLDCTPITERHSQSAWRALLRTHTFTAQIVDLTLRGVAFDSIEAFVETIQSFPLLVHLKYEGEHSSVARNTWGDSLPSLPYWKPLPNLRSLEIAQSFLPWSRLVWRWLHISQTHKQGS
ncbi:hypothetical protein CPC08DRAFT_110301 [Agrocybe pediades]|nr:hypothetical protein CPC08DRAFT_110301 [Agrocybe pediades]